MSSLRIIGRSAASLTLLFSLSYGSSFAQETLQATAPAVRDSAALSVLSQCAQAPGAPVLVPDIVASGTITRANPDSESSGFLLKSKGGDRLRTEIDLPTGRQVFVINRGSGFSLTGTKKTKDALHSTAYFRPEHLPFLSCSLDLTRSAIGVSYANIEPVGGVSAHHLIFRAASSDPLEVLSSEFHVYLDTQSLRVVKTASWVFAPDAVENRSLWETYYDGYQNINGVLIAFHITHYLAGSRFDDWNFSNVSTNVAVADGEFQ